MKDEGEKYDRYFKKKIREEKLCRRRRGVIIGNRNMDRKIR